MNTRQKLRQIAQGKPCSPGNFVPYTLQLAQLSLGATDWTILLSLQ